MKKYSADKIPRTSWKQSEKNWTFCETRNERWLQTLTQVFEYGRDENAKMQEFFQTKELEDANLRLEEQKKLYSTEAERYSRLLEEMQASAS